MVGQVDAGVSRAIFRWAGYKGVWAAQPPAPVDA